MMSRHNIKAVLKMIAMFPKRCYKSLFRNDRLADDAVNLSIVAIIKNEGQYIEEWVKYHIVVGVEKFYLYDNDSNDNTKLILQKYIDAGYVELITFPGIAKQLPAYNDAIRKFAHRSRYMAIIDADEFLYSCDPEMSVRNQVLALFEKHTKAGGIAVNWRMFGSSGFVEKPKKGGYWITFYGAQKKMEKAMDA